MYKSFVIKIIALFSILTLVVIIDVQSQGSETLSITRCEDSAAVIALIDTVFLEGVNSTQIRDITFTGDPYAVGYFTGGLIFGFDRSSGIVMSTGFSESLDDANSCATNGHANGSTSNLSDPDLVIAGGGGTIRDACVIEFDFKPAGDSVKFNYIFGSEESFFTGNLLVLCSGLGSKSVLRF